MKTTPKFPSTASLPLLFLSHSSLTCSGFFRLTSIDLTSLLFLLISLSFLSLLFVFLMPTKPANCGDIYTRRRSCQSLISPQTPHNNKLC